MRRVEIIEDLPGGAAEHPDARKPLTAFQSITAICDDCGHAAVLDREALSAMTAVPSFAYLWRHAYCAPCRAAGATRTNITLRPLLLDRNPSREQASPREMLRKDPNPTLPRRNVFGRRIPKLERMKA